MFIRAEYRLRVRRVFKGIFRTIQLSLDKRVQFVIISEKYRLECIQPEPGTSSGPLT